MPKIKLDDVEYNSEDLSNQGQATLKSLQFLEVQMRNLQTEITIYQTAQRTYVAALKAEIKQSGIEPISTDDTSEE